MSGSGEDTDDAFDLRCCALNGREVERRTRYSTTLADLVRDEFGLTGTKLSCDEEICGACTVLVDDLPVSACTFLAYDARGRSVTTIEGLAAPDGELHPLQQAFVDTFAFQCGFCTPGMIMSALALLRARPDADRDEIIDHMDGNLCRCTGYLPILAAVEQARAALASQGAT